MNRYLYEYAKAMSDPCQHAWAVTRDYFAEEWKDEDSAVGIEGPSEAPDHLIHAMREGEPVMGPPGYKLWKWTVWDDDGDRMASGVLVTEHDSPDEDESGANGALMAPLTDYAQGNWGCTRITWDGHPEWECG